MATTKNPPPASGNAREEGTLNSIEMEAFDEDMQDRIYDLLDTLHVDDNLADFVRQYAAQQAAHSSISFLNDLKAFLSS